jgi:hypothetical protein
MAGRRFADHLVPDPRPARQRKPSRGSKVGPTSRAVGSIQMVKEEKPAPGVPKK